MASFEQLTEEILKFRDQREWDQFHTPRHLTAALSIEVAELQELLLWKSEEEVGNWLESGGREDIARELADVLIFVLLLCHETNVDLADAVNAKLLENAEKYPVDLARGRAAKYTELKSEKETS